MLVLCDTNVLLRSVTIGHPLRPVVRGAFSRLRDRGDVPALVPQCCYEYYAVATRPAERNGLGLEPADALRDLSDFLEIFRLLRDERTVFESWINVVAGYAVRGKEAHDARLIAAMRRHRVTHLLTFDAKDFARYADEITVLDPHAVAASA